MTQKLHDSGERRKFESGAVRDRGGDKPRPDLISPHAQMREGMIMTLGAEKYDPRNWEQGMPISECLASAQRHIEQYKRGDTDEDHIAQARWNLGAVIHYEEEIKAGRMDPAIDDMPHYVDQPTREPDLEAYLDEASTDRTEPDPEPGDRRINPETGQEEIYVKWARDGGWEWKPIIKGVVEDPRPTAIERASINQRMEDRPYTATEITQLIRHQHGQPTYYVCGPMTNYPFLNFPAFDGARDLGQSLGFNIISPADLDRQAGIDPIEDPGSVERFRQADPDNFIRNIVKRDIIEIWNLDPKKGDGLALLPGWEESTGGLAEIALANWLGLSFVDATTFEPITNPMGV